MDARLLNDLVAGIGDRGIAVIVLVVLVLLFIARGARSVPQGHAWTVERFGRYQRTLAPGLNLIMPFVDGIGRRMSVQEQVLDVPEQTAITKDNAGVTVDAVLFYQVIDAARAAYEVANLHQALVQIAQTNMRNVVGSLDLDDVLSQRDLINSRLLTTIDAASAPWGVKVTRIEIKDLSPPQNIMTAMAKQLEADRAKRAVILVAEGERQAAIARAEGEKQALILEAEGRREAAFRDAEARERGAEAEARATDVVSAAIANRNLAAVNYFIAGKYLDALGKLAASPNQKTLVLPVEATAVLGALAGIAEIARGSEAAAPRSGHWDQTGGR